MPRISPSSCGGHQLGEPGVGPGAEALEADLAAQALVPGERQDLAPFGGTRGGRLLQQQVAAGCSARAYQGQVGVDGGGDDGQVRFGLGE